MKTKFLLATILLFICSIQIVFAQKKTQTPQKKVLVCSDCGFPLNAKPIVMVKPEYPKAARMVNVSGAVQIEVTIDEKGNVVEAKAVSGHPLLQAASINAALQTKFKPILLRGKPIRVTGIIVYNFALDEPILAKQTKELKQTKFPKSEPIIDEIQPGVIAGKATKLPKPPDISCNCRFGSVGNFISVVVLADIDEGGNVIKAVAVSGHPILKIPTQNATEKSKFNPTLISGVPSKVRRAIVYKFKVINKWSAKLMQIDVIYSSGVNK